MKIRFEELAKENSYIESTHNQKHKHVLSIE